MPEKQKYIFVSADLNGLESFCYLCDGTKEEATQRLIEMAQIDAIDEYEEIPYSEEDVKIETNIFEKHQGVLITMAYSYLGKHNISARYYYAIPYKVIETLEEDEIINPLMNGLITISSYS